MTIDDIKIRLRNERRFGSRFPVRIIFVDDFSTYCRLVDNLKGFCDTTINLAEFCRAKDTIPQFDKIKDYIRKNDGNHILLLSVGEYMRLCIQRELDRDRCQFQSFFEMQQPEDSMTRVIVPLFCCHDIFNSVVNGIDERQQHHLFELSTPPSVNRHFDITVFSSLFTGLIKPDADSLSDWLYRWTHILSKNSTCTIITQHRNYVSNYTNPIRISSYDDPFQYLKAILVDASCLDKGWENDEFWSKLTKSLIDLGGINSFRQIVLRTLNMNDFDFSDIATKWKTLDSFKKELVWLWYRINPTDDYYSYACLKAEYASEIPLRIRDEILYKKSACCESWIQQRMSAMYGFAFPSFDDSYFSLLDKMSPEARLQLLTFLTHEERAYSIKVISELLRDGADPDTLRDMIEDNYSTFATYITESINVDREVDEYMSWYRKCKLVNRYSGNYHATVNLDRFDARNKQLQKIYEKEQNYVTFWIDGFGIEYVPIFLHELSKQNVIPESTTITTALLPTNTEYNRQWDITEPNTLKWDRLDSYTHNGRPDDKSYYSCIARQLEVFTEAAKKVNELLDRYECVVVTSDHGSSRLAALAFHDSSVLPITAPQKSHVRSFGRFCEIDDNSVEIVPPPETTLCVTTLHGKTVLVMDSYRHFVASGNVAGGNSDDNDVVGEIHGGNTPEERLVPVIVLKGKRTDIPIKCVPDNESITKKRRLVSAILNFNQPVNTLDVYFGDNQAICTKTDDQKWRITLDGVTTNDIMLLVFANGKRLDSISLKIPTRGIDIRDPF